MDVINLEKAVKLMDGDLELFGDLFAIIESSLPEKYAHVEAALAARNADELELYAHQFKGALRNVAADEACALLERLEKAGSKADFDQAAELYPQVRPVVDRVLEFYHNRAWVSAFQRGGPSI